LRLAILILGVLCLTGCYESEHKPDIPGFHWHRDSLYNPSGIRAASIVVDRVDESQACIFKEAGLGWSNCTYWETGQEAYDYVERSFSQARLDASRANRCTDDDWKTSWPARIEGDGTGCYIADKWKVK
jgi:hypothetical protein